MEDTNFDLIHALEAKLEALQIYDQYIDDADQAGEQDLTEMWERLRQLDEQAADTLRQALVKRVQNNQFQ